MTHTVVKTHKHVDGRVDEKIYSIGYWRQESNGQSFDNQGRTYETYYMLFEEVARSPDFICATAFASFLNGGAFFNSQIEPVGGRFG
jgi:hypothetical protein